MGVNKVVYGGKTLVDMTDATATPETVLEGYTAYGANGNSDCWHGFGHKAAGGDYLPAAGRVDGR